jgi:hypothetical protein
VLARSFSAHHDGARLSVLVTDDIKRVVSEREEPFDLVHPDELPLARQEFAEMAAIYDPKELVTAIKFWHIRQLLEVDDVVLFLDSDVEVFAPLDELADLTATSGFVLTPHAVAPFPFDDETPTEFQIQRSGIYNTGFIGVSKTGGPALDWLMTRLRRDSVYDKEEGLWFDQRWFDFVPIYFDCHICRDPAYNVAYWNLHERTVEEMAGHFLVAGAPLRFFHFSGFDPNHPTRLTRVATRVDARKSAALSRLCSEYAEKLLKADWNSCMQISYGLEQVDGIDLTPARRRVYRALLKAADQGEIPEPPRPGDVGFAEWLIAATPSVQASGRHRAVALARRLFSSLPHRGRRKP